MLLAFVPLIIVAERLGRRPDGRPPLKEVLPDPESARLSPVKRFCNALSTSLPSQAFASPDSAKSSQKDAALRLGGWTPDLKAPPEPPPTEDDVEHEAEVPVSFCLPLEVLENGGLADPSESNKGTTSKEVLGSNVDVQQSPDATGISTADAESAVALRSIAAVHQDGAAAADSADAFVGIPPDQPEGTGDVAGGDSAAGPTQPLNTDSDAQPTFEAKDSVSSRSSRGSLKVRFVEDDGAASGAALLGTNAEPSCADPLDVNTPDPAIVAEPAPGSADPATVACTLNSKTPSMDGHGESVDPHGEMCSDEHHAAVHCDVAVQASAEHAGADIKRMSSRELQVKARARQKTFKKRLENGHFDVLLRKEGKPLGLTFRIPEAVSKYAKVDSILSTSSSSTMSPQALQIPAAEPDGSEPIQFGRYRGMPMCAVADHFPHFCQSFLRDQQSGNVEFNNPDHRRFAVYLRTARPEFSNAHLSGGEELLTCDLKDVGTLLVSEIGEVGAVNDYNREQAAAGTWDRVVLPGMHIASVNGIRGEPLAMANSLCRCEVATVRFLYLRSVDALEKHEVAELNDKNQHLLEERISKLVRMEGDDIVNSMRSQAEWEAMASNLASALVREVYKGDRLLQLPPSHVATLQASSDRAQGIPSPPQGSAPYSSMKPALPLDMPPQLHVPEMPSNPIIYRVNNMDERDALSESEESV